MYATILDEPNPTVIEDNRSGDEEDDFSISFDKRHKKLHATSNK